MILLIDEFTDFPYIISYFFGFLGYRSDSGIHSLNKILSPSFRVRLNIFKVFLGIPYFGIFSTFLKWCLVIFNDLVHGVDTIFIEIGIFNKFELFIYFNIAEILLQFLGFFFRLFKSLFERFDFWFILDSFQIQRIPFNRSFDICSHDFIWSRNFLIIIYFGILILSLSKILTFYLFILFLHIYFRFCIGFPVIVSKVMRFGYLDLCSGVFVEDKNVFMIYFWQISAQIKVQLNEIIFRKRSDKHDSFLFLELFRLQINKTIWNLNNICVHQRT